MENIRNHFVQSQHWFDNKFYGGWVPYALIKANRFSIIANYSDSASQANGESK